MTQEFSFDRSPNVQQGTIFALGAVPVGIVAYVAVYELGFYASFVSFGVAWLAASLYRLGAGQQMNRTGAVRVAVITLATIVLSIASGIVWDVAGLVADDMDGTTVSVLFTSDFWSYLVYDLSDPEYSSQYVPDIALGLVFGIVGSFSTLRFAFGRPGRVKRATTETTPPPPTAPGSNPRYGQLADDDTRNEAS